MNGLRLFILTLLLFIYLLLGAVVFHFLEQENEDSVRLDLVSIRDQLLADYPCLTEDTLRNFTLGLIKARNSGVTLEGNKTSPSNWDFSSSFFFSGTVVTTIGYGAIAPRTYGGQLYCMVYAALGIPYTAWILASIGAFYQKTMEGYIARADKALMMSISRIRIRKIFLGIVVAAGSYTIFLIIPAVIFMFLEHWTFHIAHYYTFITLTTIGFGDYIATVDGPNLEHWLYDFIVTLWNILGLAYLAVIISVIGKGEMKTEGSIRKFHAKVLKRHRNLKTGKKDEKVAMSSLEEVKFKRNANGTAQNKDENENGALYSSRNSVVGDVILPYFVDPESMKPGSQTDANEDSNVDDSEIFDEVVTIDGRIVEDERTNNMCIMLECENDFDLEAVEKIIHAALEETVPTQLGLPHHSFSLENHVRHPKKLCTQGTQTE
ncbi:potassium channel subfamily K member 16 [Strongylocentrotus purpuratus]|uniref:Potassium channel domain-containing protein n=1 Tax=Strongylocentrotus purpuratus TaxID=7668 RepID=A0A7M7HJU6_STRPU|nr:potassium channel subfamily K member 16 [Strongylocentrotus purpuratus]XP_011682444.2 potassium channel subfamily K member 16 [Strongylocentrotus purpuratus]XP_011682445.2 potassium channel subfamily K member 16 [Strongylocentrotus purpuratus]